MKYIEWVFDQVNEKLRAKNIPRWDKMNLYSSGRLYWIFRIENTVKGVCCDVLRDHGEGAVLQHPDRREARLSPDELHYVPASRLKCSVFDPIDHNIAHLSEWHGARVLIHDKHAEEAIRKALAELLPPNDKGGRPEHPAKHWYFQQGCDRRGRSVKELQREMEAAVGGKPPSPKSIYAWEEEFRQKPSA